MKPFTVIGLTLAAGLLAVAVWNSRSGATRQVAQRPPDPRDAQQARAHYPPPRAPEAATEGAPTTRRALVPRRSTRTAAGAVRLAGQLPQAQPLPTTPADDNPDDADDDEFEPLVPIEIARAALTLVGQDPEAEDAWIEAINDPALSEDDRKDLIEDLNEEGFEDPKNITLDDLPLILHRIDLIEELAPDAMDDVNEAAFAEAYKDLTEMLAKLEAQLDEEDEIEAAEAAANTPPEPWSVHQRYARRVSARR